jgi:hypothetical protein
VAENTGQKAEVKRKQPGKESKKLEAIGECRRDEKSTSLGRKSRLSRSGLPGPPGCEDGAGRN